MYSLSYIGTWQIVIILIAFLSFIFPIIALINILRSKFKKPNLQLIWVLIVLFIPIIGCVLYFSISSQHKIKRHS